MKEVTFTRDEIVTLGMAMEEFRDEYPDYHDKNRKMAERVREVLRGTNTDKFVLRADEE